jgi:hypothetical protein
MAQYLREEESVFLRPASIECLARDFAQIDSTIPAQFGKPPGILFVFGVSVSSGFELIDCCQSKENQQ